MAIHEKISPTIFNFFGRSIILSGRCLKKHLIFGLVNGTHIGKPNDSTVIKGSNVITKTCDGNVIYENFTDSTNLFLVTAFRFGVRQIAYGINHGHKEQSGWIPEYGWNYRWTM